jgi:hypothetical protein
MAALILSIGACIAIVFECLAHPMAAEKPPKPEPERSTTPYRD